MLRHDHSWVCLAIIDTPLPVTWVSPTGFDFFSCHVRSRLTTRRPRRASDVNRECGTETSNRRWLQRIWPDSVDWMGSSRSARDRL
jgi:hypothetical protein